MDRGVWGATVHGVTKSWMRLNTHILYNSHCLNPQPHEDFLFPNTPWPLTALFSLTMFTLPANPPARLHQILIHPSRSGFHGVFL